MNQGDIDSIKVRSHEEYDIDGQMHQVWNLEFPVPVKFSESEACLTPEQYEDIGRYWNRPVNLMNIRDNTVETTSYEHAYLYSYKWDYYRIVSSKCYPLYDIDGNMIGYFDYDKEYYNDEYLKANKQYWQLFKRHSDKYISTGIWAGMMLWLAYNSLVTVISHVFK